jgi:hypothetical protein
MIREEPKMTGHDPVNKPVHYNQAGIECIDAIEAMTENMSGSIAPHAANVLKYMWRCGSHAIYESHDDCRPSA